MVREAEEQAEADKIKREAADLKNDASNLIFQTERALEDLAGDVDEATKTKVEGLIKELQEAIDKDDLDLIKSKKTALEKDAQEIAVKAYEKAQKQQESAPQDELTTANGKP